MFQKCKKATALFVASILTVAFVQVSALAQPANDTAMQLKVKNDQLALYLSSDNSKLELKDLSTGYIWKSYVSEDQLTESPNKQWRNTINSICLVEYASAKDSKGNAQTARSNEYLNYITSDTAENSVTMHFNFNKLSIKFDVVFTLEKSSMVVSVPENSIEETTTKNKLVSISVLSFFGATFDRDEGYYLYPNGSGEIFEFKEQKYRQNALKEYVIPYYGNSKVEMESLLKDDGFHAMLPAYGVKVGNSAFANLITQGAYDAQLHVVPSGVSVGVNRIYNTFLYRQAYSITGSKISASGKDKEKNLGTIFEAQRVSGDRSTTYFFLKNAQADYSGMANVVRDELQKNGSLKKNLVSTVQTPMTLDLIGGVTKKSFLFTNFIAMTTFSEATDIVQDLLDNGVENLNVTYNGWSKNGIAKSPSHYKAAFKLGGKSGLKKFSAFCEERSIPMNLKVNFVNAVKGKGAFSLNQDTLRDPNGYMYTNSDGSNYLLRPIKISERNNKLLRYLNGIFAGVTYDKLGSYLFKDKTNNDFSREKSAEIFGQVASAGNTDSVRAQATGGNLYLLKDVNMVRDIPGKAKAISLSDRSVPFYQMVVHGFVNYTGTPINLFYNTTQQKLEMIEYGFVPYYEITGQSPRKLKDTDYDYLFTSEYAQWKSDILETAKEFKPLSEFYGANIVKHEAVSETLAAVTYSNNKTIVVNYDETDAIYQGVTIPKESFQIISKEE